MNKQLLLHATAFLAAMAVFNSCRGTIDPDTGTLTGKITVTELYGLIFRAENMPIYLLGNIEKLDKEHQALGIKIKDELGDRSAIEPASVRLGVKKYVDIANSLFVKHVVKESKTDSSGRYKITGIPPGKYRLLFSYSTFVSDPYSSLMVKKHYHWFFDIEIKAGELLNLDLNKYNARGAPYWDII